MKKSYPIIRPPLPPGVKLDENVFVTSDNEGWR
jgi:hypothetical protein